jgi:hypothetical protein
MKKASLKVEKPELKLDLGCGNNPKEGFTGIDCVKFDKVSQVVDLRKGPYPWKGESVEEIHSSHFVEHLTAQERVLFINEVYRILIPEGKCTLIIPHWASCRAYGDPTHQWPPVSEFWFYYLKKEWRDVNAPHTDIKYNENGFNCDFEANWGYNLRPDIVTRNQEYQMHAMSNFKEVCQDIIATLIKK